MTIPLTYDRVAQLAAQMRSQFGPPTIIISTPLMAPINGFWRVERDGHAYILIGPPQLASLIAHIEPAPNTPAYVGYLAGIPIIEDGDLARSLILQVVGPLQQPFLFPEATPC